MNQNVTNDKRVMVDVGLQVAGIAAQVTAALRSENQERCSELERKLTLAQKQLDPQDQVPPPDAPPGLAPFIDVMRGLLRGDDVSARARGLPLAYRAVYEHVVESTATHEEEGELTIRQVLDEVSHNVITVVRFGTFDQRQQMIDVLLKMQHESAQRPHLAALADFTEAARMLLEGGDPTPVATRLIGPFRDKWDHLVNALEA